MAVLYGRAGSLTAKKTVSGPPRADLQARAGDLHADRALLPQPLPARGPSVTVHLNMCIRIPVPTIFLLAAPEISLI